MIFHPSHLPEKDLPFAELALINAGSCARRGIGRKLVRPVAFMFAGRAFAVQTWR